MQIGTIDTTTQNLEVISPSDGVRPAQWRVIDASQPPIKLPFATALASQNGRNARRATTRITIPHFDTNGAKLGVSVFDIAAKIDQAVPLTVAQQDYAWVLEILGSAQFTSLNTTGIMPN